MFSRQIVALWLVGSLLSLAACGSSDQPLDEIPEVVFNCPADASQIEALQAEIPAFTEKSGIRIKLNPFTGQEKLYAMMAAGQAPDIFYTNKVVRDRLAAEGRLLDLRQISKDDPFVDRLWPESVQEGISIDGGWYSMSNWAFTCGVYYNRDLFDSAGIPYPDSSWTWDDMRRIARKLTLDKDGDGKTDQYGIFIGSHFVPAFERMNHAPLRREALLVDIPSESADVYRKYLALMDDGLMPDLRRVQAMGMQAPQMLQSGRVAMLVEGVPHTTLFDALTIRWGLAPLPRFDHKSPLYFRAGSGGLSVSAQTANPKAAWEVLKWIVAGASIYQPNPVLRDADFVGGWEAKYPQLVDSGFRGVWTLSEQHNGGDWRFFVRYSSWTSNAILEKLAPELDQLWARRISVDDFLASVPEVNAAARRELQQVLKNSTLLPAFRDQIEKRAQQIEQ